CQAPPRLATWPSCRSMAKPPPASGVNSLVVGALMGQVNAVGTARFSSLSGAVPVRDLAFLPREFVLAGARMTLAAPGGGDEQAPATSGGSDQNVLGVQNRTLTAPGGDEQAPATSGGSDQNVLGVQNSPEPFEWAEVQGVVFGDRNRDDVLSDGEPLLSGRVVRLVKATGAVVAVTKTGPEGEYRFDGVPAEQYRVEVEGCSEWAGKASPAFTVGTRPVTLRPLGLPPVGAAAEGGEAPAEAGTPPARGQAAGRAPRA